MRLQTHSSAASVRYLGHTPITARQRDELCRGNIFMEYSHFFEYYFSSYFETEPWQGLEATSSGSREMTARVIGFESGPV